MAIGDLTISGDGKRGEPGQDGKGYQGHARESGVLGTTPIVTRLISGLNGDDGTTPTEGSDGQIVHVSLGRAGPTSAATRLFVVVDKHEDFCPERFAHSDLKEEFHHDLGAQGRITISASGGVGGRGGSGGSGQGG